MTRYIDKSAVVAEIERRKNKLLDHIIFERDKEWVVRTAHQLNRIILFLDTLEAKEVDLKLNKLYKQGWKDAVAKASIFVYQLATAFPDTSYTDADNMTDGFKKYMEEQQ